MAQWRQNLVKSLHQSKSMPESRYFQMATIDAQGFPCNRTVVYRGITEHNQIEVISDTRSDKFNHLSNNPISQLCWYFSKTREQYRFTCRASIVTLRDGPDMLKSHWAKLSDAGKKQFLWGRPGTPRNTGAPLNIEGDFNCIPEHFCVILLSVEFVDYLSLRGNPQYREQHHKDAEGNWVCQSVIP